MESDKLQEDITRLTTEIAASPDAAPLYLQRGKLHHTVGNFGEALNDFLRVQKIAETQTDLGDLNIEATGYISMLREIFAFRYTDIYNP